MTALTWIVYVCFAVVVLAGAYAVLAVGRDIARDVLKGMDAYNTIRRLQYENKELRKVIEAGGSPHRKLPPPLPSSCLHEAMHDSLSYVATKMDIPND